MDDDLDVGSGSHILASVSRVRVERQKMQLPVPKPRGPRPLWGFTYTKFPKPGEAKFVITDEVRFTALCLIVVGAVCGQCRGSSRKKRGRRGAPEQSACRTHVSAPPRRLSPLCASHS